MKIVSAEVFECNDGRQFTDIHDAQAHCIAKLRDLFSELTDGQCWRPAANRIAQEFALFSQDIADIREQLDKVRKFK